MARDEFLVALPAGHALAAQARIPPRALSGERMLLLEDGNCLRDQALAACGQQARPGIEDFAATSLHTLVQMVAGGLGITLLPRLAVDAGIAAGTAIALRPLASRDAFRTLGLTWRPNAPRAADFRRLAPLLAASAAVRA